MNSALTRPDQLRQRVAFALHKFIVVAGRDMNNNEASWYAPYLQTIDRDAFGNFRTLLKDVTLNPGMGRYLDMAGNSRVAPNENYARELMQLFSIGTDILNQDGTPILDVNVNRIPTYGQTEITNFARVFTGWVIPNTTTNTFSGQSVPDYIRPMAFSNNTGANGPFDIGAKTLLNGQNLPACTSCTGNAANKFGQVDDYVAWRLKRVLVARHGRHLRPGQAAQWTLAFFHALGLHRLRGTIRYPEAA